MWCIDGYTLPFYYLWHFINPALFKKEDFLLVFRKTCKICNSTSLAKQGQVNTHLVPSYLNMIKPMLSKFKVPTPIPLASPISIEGPSLDLRQVVNSIKCMIMD